MLGMLIKDEFEGFYKAKAIIALWVGLPILSFFIYWLTPKVEGMPFGVFFATVVSGIGGTIACVLLAINIIHETTRNVYDLFLVRLIKKEYLLISKFVAVIICLLIAVIISLLVGLIVDFLKGEQNFSVIFDRVVEAFWFSVSTIFVSSSIGIFVGVISPTVVLGVILIIFFSSNVTSILLLLPTMLNLPNPVVLTLLISFVASIAFLFLSIAIFNKRQF